MPNAVTQPRICRSEAEANASAGAHGWASSAHLLFKDLPDALCCDLGNDAPIDDDALYLFAFNFVVQPRAEKAEVGANGRIDDELKHLRNAN